MFKQISDKVSLPALEQSRFLFGRRKSISRAVAKLKPGSNNRSQRAIPIVNAIAELEKFLSDEV